MKDIIEIMNKYGERRPVELVTKFNISGYQYNYIIYRELDGSHNYIARYQGEDIVNLDSNISETEVALAKVVFKGVKQ